MTVDHYLMEKQCGNETNLPTFILIKPTRNEVITIEQTSFSVINHIILPVSEELVRFRQKEQMR